MNLNPLHIIVKILAFSEVFKNPWQQLFMPAPANNPDAIICLKNIGSDTFLNWGIYSTQQDYDDYLHDAYCSDIQGNGESCLDEITPSKQQCISVNAYGSVTETLGLKSSSDAFSFKYSASSSGLLDEDGQIVADNGLCNAEIDLEVGYAVFEVTCEEVSPSDDDDISDVIPQTYETGVSLRGINFSGQEWASGTYLATNADLNNIVQMGFNLIRVPVAMEKLISSPNDTIDWGTGNAKNLDLSIQKMLDRGITVIFDAHNYMHFNGQQLTGEELTSFWQQIAERYSGLDVIFDIQNEPHDLSPTDSAETLFALYQPVEDMFSSMKLPNQRIYGPSNWNWVGDMSLDDYQEKFLALQASSEDPSKVAINVHYYDTNPSGGGSGYGACQEDGLTINHVDAVADWAIKHDIKIFVSEYNGGAEEEHCMDYLDEFHQFANENAATSSQGGFFGTTMWAYYARCGSGDELDINEDCNPLDDPRILQMQSIDYLTPPTEEIAEEELTSFYLRGDKSHKPTFFDSLYEQSAQLSSWISQSFWQTPSQVERAIEPSKIEEIPQGLDAIGLK